VNEEDRKFFADILDCNADTCSGIAVQLKTVEDRVGVETIETIHAILAVAEAVRILARIQLKIGKPI